MAGSGCLTAWQDDQTSSGGHYINALASQVDMSCYTCSLVGFVVYVGL